MTATATLEPATIEAIKEPTLPSRIHPSIRPGVERVVLTGFMGSGKTTVGAMLAEQMGWGFVDLDAEIERRCGTTVPNLFAEFGEDHFRKQETSALASLLGHNKMVLALGGGALEALGNRLLLEQTPATYVVYLHAPFEVLHERCIQQAARNPGATKRPVLADRALAEARFNARLRHYERIANLRLETSNLSASEALDAVLAKLQR